MDGALWLLEMDLGLVPSSSVQVSPVSPPQVFGPALFSFMVKEKRLIIYVVMCPDPHAQGYAMVFDIQGKVLMKTPYQVGAQAICMSKSGKYFAYGFLSLYLWELRAFS